MLRHISKDSCCQFPCPHGGPLPMHASVGDPQTLTRRFDSVFFPLDPGAHKILFVPSKSGVYYPSLVEVLQSNPASLQSKIPGGFSVPWLYPQAKEPDVRSRTFTTV